MDGRRSSTDTDVAETQGRPRARDGRHQGGGKALRRGGRTGPVRTTTTPPRPRGGRKPAPWRRRGRRRRARSDPWRHVPGAGAAACLGAVTSWLRSLWGGKGKKSLVRRTFTVAVTALGSIG